MRQVTKLDHELRIEAAVRHLAAHLDERIDLRDLADQFCLSRFHFHRIFQALLGETVGELHRRLRLERAADRLRTTPIPITELAFEAGYATHEAFIRAFRAAFGCAPSTLRRRLSYDGRLPTRNGIHFGGPLEIQFIAPEGEIKMHVEVREAPPLRAVCMSHSGPYFMIGQTFGALGAWMGETRTPTGHGVALYYDDPSVTPADELRSDAGAFVSDDFTTTDSRVHLVDVPGGAFAVGTHHGPYDGLPGAWDDMRKWINASGRAYRDAVSFEVYLNNCMDTPPADLVTELYVPVQ